MTSKFAKNQKRRIEITKIKTAIDAAIPVGVGVDISNIIVALSDVTRDMANLLSSQCEVEEVKSDDDIACNADVDKGLSHLTAAKILESVYVDKTIGRYIDEDFDDNTVKAVEKQMINIINWHVRQSKNSND